MLDAEVVDEAVAEVVEDTVEELVVVTDAEYEAIEDADAVGEKLGGIKEYISSTSSLLNPRLYIRTSSINPVNSQAHAK